MDRRFAVDRFARLRASILRSLPRPIADAILPTWNRAKWRLAERRADVLLVSYPKAGRTWLATLLGHAFAAHFGIEGDSEELTSLNDADRRVPRFHRTHDGVMPGALPSEIRRDKARYRGRTVILLVRDPRDILVSQYHHLRHRTRVLDSDLEAFAAQERSGFGTILAFHRAWLDALDVPARTLVVRYEDLAATPSAELDRVLRFLGIVASAETLERAVAASSFAAMRRRESSGDATNAARRTSDPDNPDAYKARRGEVGGYLDALAPSTIARLDARLRDAGLARFGYG